MSGRMTKLVLREFTHNHSSGVSWENQVGLSQYQIFPPWFIYHNDNIIVISILIWKKKLLSVKFISNPACSDLFLANKTHSEYSVRRWRGRFLNQNCTITIAQYSIYSLRLRRDFRKETLLLSFSAVCFSGALSTVPSSSIVSMAESQNYATHTKTIYMDIYV